MEQLDGIHVRSLNEAYSSSILTFNSEKISAHDIALSLDDIANIQVRSGLICSNLGIAELKIKDVVQVSTHVYNTIEHIDLFIDGLKQINSMF